MDEEKRDKKSFWEKEFLKYKSIKKDEVKLSELINQK